MTIRKWLGVFASSLLLAVISSVGATEQGNATRCSFQGSYLFYIGSDAAFMSTAAGQTASFGTYLVDYPGLDPTLDGYSPTAVKATTFRGTWERVSGNTFVITVIALALDADRHTLWIGKLNATDTLSENCSIIDVKKVSLAVFDPSDNPFEDTPLFVIPLDDHLGYRMRTDPPAN